MIVEKFVLYDYLKQYGEIGYSDMLKIQKEENISIAFQMKVLEVLESENKALNKSVSRTEPLYVSLLKKSPNSDYIDDEYTAKNVNIREKIFKYLYDKNGTYNELEFFMEHGVSFESQTKMLNKLLDEDAIVKTFNGYTIKRK